MQQINSLSNEATDRYEKMAPLIKFLERRMIIAQRSSKGSGGQAKMIAADFEKFQEIRQKARTIMDTKVNPYLARYQLLEMIIISDENLITLSNCTERFRYLQNLSNEIVWDLYRPAIELIDRGHDFYEGLSNEHIH